MSAGEPTAAALSFCTTCANRSESLKATLAENVAALTANPDCEWIIVNYGSSDDLHEFMLEALPRLPRQVVYAVELSRPAWNLSAAKNLAHRLATGAVLMSLDCDNFIANAPEKVRSTIARGKDIVHLWSGVLGDGTCGRVAIRQEWFYRLGGYDEAFLPMGYQDIDFMRRATASGCIGVRCSYRGKAPRLAIPNTKQDSVRHCAPPGVSWEDYNRANRERSDQNVRAGNLRANPSGWRAAEVQLYRGGSTEQCGLRRLGSEQGAMAETIPSLSGQASDSHA